MERKTLSQPGGENLEVETTREASPPDSPPSGRKRLPKWIRGYLGPFLKPADPDSPEKLCWRKPSWTSICEALVFLVFTVYFLSYGLTPFFGGDGLGLVGADEPRYAQIAHEMLDRFDAAQTLKGKLSACVTPYLYGLPWLEKPALYYWRAMFLFRDFGVHDWSARLPSTTFAFVMIGLIYLHMRRFRPGGHLDAALITVACAGIMGFARGASTDMQMAAPLAIGLLGWYAWYETDSKFWLFDIYFFTGVATLAKGPVAPFLAAVIITAFAFLRREWSILRRTLWWPGVVLYFAMVLPWFIAVQRQNPTFFREFFFEHNLLRFATDRYQHVQPFWYYVPVVLLAIMPWTVIAVRALADGIQTSVREWRLRHSSVCKPCAGAPGDAFPEFLVLWALIPIVFFSFSRSKLPGYILPSLPPIAILTGDYLFRAPAGGAESLGAFGPRDALRRNDHGRAVIAMVCGPRRADAAYACDHCRCAGGVWSGAADFSRGKRLRRGSAAAGHHRRAGGPGFLSLWRRPALRHSRGGSHQARDSSAGSLLLRAPAGRPAGRLCSSQRDCCGLSCAARHRVRTFVLSQSRGCELRGERRAG